MLSTRHSAILIPVILRKKIVSLHVSIELGECNGNSLLSRTIIEKY